MAEKDWRARAANFWQDGKLTIAWLAVFVAYIGFRIANINAPELTNAFVTITGIFVGTLSVTQSKKKAEETARVEKKADTAVAASRHAVDTVESVTGGMPVIVEDPHTKQLRAQKPPQIARKEADRRSRVAREENDRRTNAARDEDDKRTEVADKESDDRRRIADGDDSDA